MYVMILNGKLHTSKLQKLVSNRIFHKEEKERKILHMYGSRKKCKNQFPFTKQKLHSFNEIFFDKNDCNENVVFSWTYWDLARTNKTPESVHFI